MSKKLSIAKHTVEGFASEKTKRLCLAAVHTAEGAIFFCLFIIPSSLCPPLCRLLEEGDTEGAEEQKQRIEQLQRDRRRVLQDNNMTHQPRFFQ